MSSTDELLEEAAARGLLLNNMFQLDNGRWRANWRDDRGGHPFGEAETAHAALRLALAAVPSTELTGAFS